MSTAPCVAGLTNKGIILVDCKDPYQERTLRDETTGNIRSIIFSRKGTYLAYRTNKKAEIIKCSNWSTVLSVNGNVKDMFFSPLDNYFVVWEMFVMNKRNPQGKPNLHVFKSATGELVASFVQKLQTRWEPQWSSDEKLFALQVDGRVQIYIDGKLDRYTQQIQAEKLQSFSMSPSLTPNYYFSVFTLGKSGQPSFWRVYQFPNFNQAVVSRSSFQADKAVFHWNRRGTDLLVLTQTDVDKTGRSYYGKQSLSYGDVTGNTGNMIFSKEGPIHAIAWNPGNWNECIAVYGHAPAKATLFNAKCEPLFEFGTGAWNAIYYAPDGNHVLLGGFGNIASGNIEVWDNRDYKKLGSCAAPATTALQWDPRSECFLTATTYPRLTVGNGYQIWHYTGVLMHKRAYPEKEYLLAITWQPGAYPKSELSRASPKGIVDTMPIASGAYRPPGARNKPGETASAGPSKAAIKQKGKREARKARKVEERAQGDAVPLPPDTSRPFAAPTGDPDTDKRIKNLNKKLTEIEKLKQLKEAGKRLELNQEVKIQNEAALLKELQQLGL